MALTWELGDIKDWETVTRVTATADDPSNAIKVGDTLLNPVTSALIWHTMNVKIGRITEANADEFWARVALVEKLYGASLGNSDGPRPITRDDVRAHIGLHCNVVTEKRPAFVKAQVGYFLDRKADRFKDETRLLAEQAAAVIDPMEVK